MPKKKRKKKKTSKRYELYDAKGTLKRKNKFCPKCGQGTFLAQHKDRVVCGRCGYMEKIEATQTKIEDKPKKEAPKEEKPKKPEVKK